VKNNLAEPARAFLAVLFLAILIAGPLGAGCGLLISSLGTQPMEVLVTALKLV
jgi:hypothetical protein